MKRPGENEGDLNQEEYLKLSDEEKNKYRQEVYSQIFLRGGYEDVDLFLRAKNTFKMKIVMSNRAVYWHKQGATRWNCEKNNYINNFGIESKRIEDENLDRFINKWGFNPHRTPIWEEKRLLN